jgi:hypothetical protein
VYRWFALQDRLPTAVRERLDSRQAAAIAESQA